MKKLSLFFLIVMLMLVQNNVWAQGRDRVAMRRAVVAQRTGLGGGEAGQPATKSRLGLAIKQPPADWKLQGALVEAVVIGSAADQAGIASGDIIEEFAGTLINKADELPAFVLTLALNKSYKAVILRGERKLTLNVMLQPEPSSASLKRSLSDINVLKYAFIDSKSRQVTLVGSYDKTYATGPIPYYDLLKEALQSPYPYFSLEPTQTTRTAVDNLQAYIASDVKRMWNDRAYVNSWTQRLMSLLLKDPQLQQDHRRFIKKAADAFKVTEPEVFQILSLQNNSNSYPSPEMQVIMIKVLKGLGYANVAFALESADGTREGARKVFAKLGRLQEVDPIWAKWDSGEMSAEQAKAEIASRLYGAYLLEMGMPASEVSAKENAARKGTLSLDDLQNIYTEKLNSCLVDNVGIKIFNGLTLSQALLSKLYNVPLPQMDLVYKNLPARTNLAKVMFEADYMLKTLTALPDVKEKVPGHLTNLEYLEQEARKQGTRTPAGAGGEVRNTILPGEVTMRVSPDGQVVVFDEARVKIESALLNPVGDLGNTEALVRNSFAAYGNFLTGRYDLYAKAYPEFHRMREVSKLIALARWAKANNYKLAVDRVEGFRAFPSAVATGFWNAVFTADEQEFSLTVAVLGGADFSEEHGDSWVQSKIDPLVENSVVKQLVASAAFAQKAALEAVGGNLENARDLAEKSAQAMIGNIDASQFPGLIDVPVPPEPAMAAALGVEAQVITGDSLRAMDEAKTMRQQADALPDNSAQEAAELRDAAAKQQKDAEDNLKRLNDAINAVRQDPASTGTTVAALHSGAGTPFFGAGSNPAVVTSTPLPPPPPPATPPIEDTIAESPEAPGKAKEELLAELASLRSQIEATKSQLMKLNKTIQSDINQYNEWEKVSSDALESFTNTWFGLMLDATSARMLKRYIEMDRIAQKLPGAPYKDLARIQRTRALLEMLSGAKTLKDFNDLLFREHMTLPQFIDDVRDGIGIMNDALGLGSTLETGEWKYKLGKYFYPASAAWKYGSAMVDFSYNLVQYSTSWDAIKQMEENDPNIRLALKKLSERLTGLVQQTKDIEAQLKAGELNK